MIFKSASRWIINGVCAIALLLCGLITAQAQTNGSLAFNGGTLEYTVTSNGACGTLGNATIYKFGSFQFVYGSTTYPMTGGPAIDLVELQFPSQCPSEIDPATLTFSSGSFGANCAFTFTPTSTTTGNVTASGCSFGTPFNLYPKYVIMGVTYAPPGPSSYVQYTGTTSVGNTTSIGQSFSNDVGFSVKLSVSTGKTLGIFKAGSSVSSSTDYTQSSSSTNTVTVSKLTSLAYKTMGTGNAFSPINSDYDTVWLWLNPVLMMTYLPASGSNPASIQWNGYAFDSSDPSGTLQPDVYPVQVGWLNGHFGSSSSINTILARSWQGGSNYVWPSGQGPGLTSTDLASIIAADPLTNSSYEATEFQNAPLTTADGRFTIVPSLSDGPNPIPYQQSGPGNGGGTTTQYGTTQTNTQSEAQGTTTTIKQAFSVTENLNSFWDIIDLSLTESDTLTWTYSWNNTLTTTTTLVDALSITGPGCTATTEPCNPIYSGPGQFLVYQDNQYGTFAFVPSN